ncbi:hypothetical protein [Cellulosilyticum sp. I15G10I2]|uniref:hypothetical protein n=1 Tax=Cellulosilyticum sp. I15G10I2 TaxID=1892843 RepID=UPI00085CA8FC|nr:hypothetical protein [Cellulosilyticum sp. I15G10I2]
MRLTTLEIILRAIPEGFLYILGFYTYTKTKININRYIISSILGGGLIGIMRGLPISYGIHTILLMISLTAVGVLINKINIIKSIQAGILVFASMFICEAINLLLIFSIFTKEMEHIFADPKLKIIYGIPSLVILGSFLGIYYRRLSKRKELQSV